MGKQRLTNRKSSESIVGHSRTRLVCCAIGKEKLKLRVQFKPHPYQEEWDVIFPWNTAKGFKVDLSFEIRIA